MGFQDKIVNVLSDVKDLTGFLHYKKQFKRLLKERRFEDKEYPGEKEWLSKWKKLSPYVERYSYRFFSNYMDNTQDIVPENAAMRYVENVLNPWKYRKYFEDKNEYGKYIPAELMPRTLVRRIGGGPLLGADYKVLKDKLIIGGGESVIIKPSVETNSGVGIMKFESVNGKLISVDTKTELTPEFLRAYGDDFIVQEAVNQHPDMAKLCGTSLNTLRICLYRSVIDNKPHVNACILRVGKDGSVIDNAHQGGKFAAVNVNTGKIGNFVIDMKGRKDRIWNGIDYATDTTLNVPNWDKVIEFAEKIGNCYTHMRYLNIDVAIDSNGSPVFIEGNVTGSSYWLYMFTNQNPFGTHEKEILEYCTFNKEKRKFNILHLI